MFPDVGNNATVISLPNGPVVEGDVKVMFESSAVSNLTRSCCRRATSYFDDSWPDSASVQGLPKGYEDVPFYFWFNTSFIEENKYVAFFWSPVSHLILCT